MTVHNLHNLFASVSQAQIPSDADPLITGIAFDSRAVKPGYLFIAVKGEHVDGRDYVDAAKKDTDLPVVIVADTELASAQVSCRFYDYPSQSLRVVGITGTNGKTTTAILAAHILRCAGRKTAVMGTLGVSTDSKNWTDTGHTTPQAPEVQRILAELRDQGITDVVMEVSSHAISQKRTYGLELDAAAMLNLTQDHLDYYGDMEHYTAAKKQLFDEYPSYTAKTFHSILNLADSTANGWASQIHTTQLNFGPEGSGANAIVSNIDLSVNSVSYTLCYQQNQYHITVPLGGAFQVWNSAAAWCCCVAMGINPQTAADALRCSPNSPGRFEMIPNNAGVTVLVDYAHTPDGLKNVLSSARALKPRELVVVFGCGGDRDGAKRPIMGSIAAKAADRIYVTSDNPRTENPNTIIDQIMNGIPSCEMERVTVDPDRRSAIIAALSSLKPGDLLVIAGKGHEDYQIIGTQKHPFDDRIVASEWFQDR